MITFIAQATTEVDLIRKKKAAIKFAKHIRNNLYLELKTCV